MKNFLVMILSVCLVMGPIQPVHAKKSDVFVDNVHTLYNKIEARVYSFKRKKHYTAVEIGFTNLESQYVKFRPVEIYLDDELKYSQPLLTEQDVAQIQTRKPSNSIFPTALAVGLGIASLATSRGNKDAAFGLGMAALGVGGTALLTKGLEDRATKNKLIGFKSNKIDEIDKIPPGMTLGGVLYFPPTKKPKSVTLVVKDLNGRLETKTFPLIKAKKSKKSRSAKQY